LEVVGDVIEKLAFFEESDPLRENFQNFVPKGFTVSQIHVLCANFVKFGPPEIGKVVRYLTDKKTKFRFALSLSLLRGSRPKSAGASGKQCTHSASNFIQIPENLSPTTEQSVRMYDAIMFPELPKLRISGPTGPTPGPAKVKFDLWTSRQ